MQGPVLFIIFMNQYVVLQIYQISCNQNVQIHLHDPLRLVLMVKTN